MLSFCKDYYGITFPAPATLTGRDGSLANNPYSGECCVKTRMVGELCLFLNAGHSAFGERPTIFFPTVSNYSQTAQTS